MAAPSSKAATTTRRVGAESPWLIAEPVLLELITAPTDSHDITLPALTAEAVLKADAKDPTEQMLRAEPVEPMLSTEPRDAIDITDPSDQSDHNDEGMRTSISETAAGERRPTLAQIQSSRRARSDRACGTRRRPRSRRTRLPSQTCG